MGTANLERTVRKGHSKGVTFEERLEWSEGVSYANIWGKTAPGPGNCKCKGPEVWVGLYVLGMARRPVRLKQNEWEREWWKESSDWWPGINSWRELWALRFYSNGKPHKEKSRRVIGCALPFKRIPRHCAENVFQGTSMEARRLVSCRRPSAMWWWCVLELGFSALALLTF